MAEKMDIDIRDAFNPYMEAMARDGALLVSMDSSGKPSGMTVSWGTLGTIWGRPILTVMVRPSRNTFRLIEETGDFTLNLLPTDLGKALDFWGKYSGRDAEKWSRTGLKPAPARRVKSPIVEQGILHFECKMVSRADLKGETMLPDIVTAYYSSGDYHRVYYGEVLACYGL